MPPVPDRLTVCGLPVASSAMFSVALSFPSVVGVKVTLMVQLFPAAIVSQLLLSAKSPLLEPVIVMLLTVTGPEPVFVTVTVCGGLVVSGRTVPNERDVGETVTLGAVPVPDRLTFCGLPPALSVIASVELLLPVAVGVKVTLMVHLAPAVSELPQLLVSAKSPLLPPVIAIPLIVTELPPVFERVTALDELVVFTC